MGDGYDEGADDPGYRESTCFLEVDEPWASVIGREFERLGQERRVSVLAAYGVAGPDSQVHFDTIGRTRRKYFHLWSQDHDHLPRDAVACFHAAVALVITAIGQDIRDGALVLNPRFARYLERQGVYEP